jgi:signal transduction histidine kinase
LWYALLLTLTIVILGTVTYGVVRYRMIQNIDRELDDMARTIRDETIISEAPVFNQPAIKISIPPLHSFYAAGIFVQAWRLGSGEEPILEGSSTNIDSFDTPLDPQALGIEQIQLRNTTFEDRSVRVLTHPLFNTNGNVVGYLQIGDDLSQVNAALQELLIVMLITSGFAIAGALVMSTWFSHRALQQIEKITHAAASIVNTDDLKTRLIWPGPKDELGRLAEVFNHMMGRIEKLFGAQQRLVADVSHELRTPLTSIKGNLELMRLYGYDEESLKAMEIEAKRMVRLVDELLMLARADYGSITIELFPTDLDTVVLEAYEHARTLLKDRELTLTLKHFEPVRVSGNPDRLKQLLINLLSNAIKFTPDGGDIAIGLERINSQAVLWVKDTGIGISKADQPHIFERFYQSDPARTYNDGGFGLGLAIAKWIVHEHNGSIRVYSTETQGTTIIVTLPVYHPYEFKYSNLDQPTIRTKSKFSITNAAAVTTMPTPYSLSLASLGTRSKSMKTSPLFGVNLIALLSRLIRNLLRRFGLPPAPADSKRSKQVDGSG